MLQGCRQEAPEISKPPQDVARLTERMKERRNKSQIISVLRIPHDPAALERHFSDDDDGPVSSQGYMPYLSQFILDKVIEGTFVKEEVDELCWTLSSKKNYRLDAQRVLSNQDAMRLWCLFNFLADDRYPLTLVPEEAEYLLRKVSSVMPVELTCVELEEFLSQDAVQKDGLSVWSFLDVVNAAAVSRGLDGESIGVAVEKVYREMVGNVLKEGYLWKKGHLRRNWTERWFCLKPGSLSYFVGEDCRDCKGVIEMDQNCCAEVLSDREGKRCMFCVKTLNKTFEISAPDSRQRQEWITAIQTALRLSAEGRVSLHEELKARRRELREERERRRAAGGGDAPAEGAAGGASGAAGRAGAPEGGAETGPSLPAAGGAEEAQPARGATEDPAETATGGAGGTGESSRRGGGSRSGGRTPAAENQRAGRASSQTTGSSRATDQSETGRGELQIHTDQAAGGGGGEGEVSAVAAGGAGGAAPADPA
ncbi:hypothetical protein G5714_021142 [Onychostoma macrolepis]|uniref:PH domain-containing protein n=1 Tax=Onychostoma macrolepis TaxID=369639 RepID=A0A7J6BQ97_9TELE|nr:hypothetical protein G5714_021142 [Onychostoma macrolepis]